MFYENLLNLIVLIYFNHNNDYKFECRLQDINGQKFLNYEGYTLNIFVIL